MSRDPGLLKTADINSNNIIKIDHLPEFDIADYDLFDKNEFNKYLSNIERICRTSFEYKRYVKFLRENMNFNKCTFYENVNNIDTFKIKIHIHHEPLTLYDIVTIVYNKRSALMESLSEEIMAKEVMYIHYNLMVGLIPLAETVHELVHNQYLFIPTTSVMGWYDAFLDAYDEYVPEEIKTKIRRIEDMTEEYTGEDKYVLDKNFLYVDFSGAYNFPKYDDIIDKMNYRIEDIDNGREDVNDMIVPFYIVKK